MVRHYPRRGVKTSLRGWFWWFLIPAPFLALLAFETWLNTETYRNDYAISAITARLEELKDTRDSLKIEQARLETMDRIVIEAPDLGLVEPEPGQIQIIYYTEESDGPVAAPAPYALARLTPGRESFGSAGLLAGGLPLEPEEGAPWEFNSRSTLASLTPMEDLLRRVIRTACGPYPGGF